MRATKRGRASDEAGQSMHAVAFLVNEVRPDNASNSRPPKAQQNRSNAPPGEPERAAAAAGDAGGLRAGTAELVATRAAADAGHETIDVEQEKGTRREAAAESGATWWLIAGEAELVATPAAEEVRHETIAVVQQDSIRPVSALATAAWTVVDIADAEAAARARDGACGNAQRLIAALRSAQAEAAHAVAGAAVAAEELRTAVRDSVVARIELEVTRRSLAEAEGEEKTLRILLVSEREDAANVKAELQARRSHAAPTCMAPRLRTHISIRKPPMPSQPQCRSSDHHFPPPPHTEGDRRTRGRYGGHAGNVAELLHHCRVRLTSTGGCGCGRRD